MQQLKNWTSNLTTWRDALPLAMTVAFAAVIISGARYIAVDSSSAKIASAESGLQTCFSRVTQAITALSLGDSASPYLKKDFNKTTSECFADFKNSMASLAASSSVNNSVNDLLGKAHWLAKEIPTASATQLPNLYTRYAQVEETVMKTWEEIDGLKQENITTEHFWFQAFTWTSVFGFLLVAFNFATSVRPNAQASAEVNTHSNTQSNIQAQEADATQEIEEYEFVAPELNTVADIVNDIYESIDAKAKSMETDIHLKNNVDLPFKGDVDVFGQLVHTAFSFAIDKAVQSDENKIDATIKNLGNIVRADFLIDGQCFNSDELESTYSKTQKVSNINLTLLNEIAAQNNVEIVLKNEFTPTGARAVLAVSFEDTVAQTSNAGEQSAQPKIASPKISSIVKGTKKDILAAMN